MKQERSSGVSTCVIKANLSRSPAPSLKNLSMGMTITFVAATGGSAKEIASVLGVSFVNEIVALASGFGRLYPETGTVIDIGGEDSKLITLERDGKNGIVRVKDFSMNALCAAGTGAFLDQQASRLRFTIEEFSEVRSSP
jgi:activator of 2-hydroxyglutaryl-CoA dehydratase